jgi:hypothetical protein
VIVILGFSLIFVKKHPKFELKDLFLQVFIGKFYEEVYKPFGKPAALFFFSYIKCCNQVRRFPVELFYFLVAGIYFFYFIFYLFIFNIVGNGVSKKTYTTQHTQPFSTRNLLTHLPISLKSGTQSLNISPSCAGK